MKKILILGILAIFIAVSSFSYAAGKKDSRDILKEGLLGAGSGAVGGLASGAKGRDIWKGALAGVGVNIIGGALLDSISGEHVEHTDKVAAMGSKDAYSGGYKDGYSNGYKQGYTQGYKDGVKKE